MMPYREYCRIERSPGAQFARCGEQEYNGARYKTLSIVSEIGRMLVPL